MAGAIDRADWKDACSQEMQLPVSTPVPSQRCFLEYNKKARRKKLQVKPTRLGRETE
jgi:hypothetical protein